jgi:hypothetical protein
MHKTQCFLSPEGDHYRTRLTHTLEVSQIGRSVARLLRLNEDLVEAACLGHDLGHTPFGHAGERVLNSLCPTGFAHNEQSVRTVTVLERDGRGLNLTVEVIDAILCHTGPVAAKTLEGRLIKYADRIAYINHDIDDAIRAGILTDAMIPEKFSRVLGGNHSTRIDTMVKSLVSGLDKCNRDRFDVTKFKFPDYRYDRTMRRFSYAFDLRVGKGRLLVCGFNFTSIDSGDPAALAMLRALVSYCRSDEFGAGAQISTRALRDYLSSVAARGPQKEGMMTQYWQLDEEPVESMAYWTESERYLREDLK